MKYTSKQIAAFIKGVHSGKIKVNSLPKDLYLAIAKELEKALYKGFGGTVSSFSFGTMEADLIAELRSNVYMFSGAKTYQQVRYLSTLATKTKNFSEYKNEALQVFENYNVNYLRAEYVTCIGQGAIARQWADIESTKKMFPYLKYNAVMDKNTAETCRSLDGIILPVNSSLWSKYAPLNHFNCRCILEKIDKFEDVKVMSDVKLRPIVNLLDEKVPEEFKMNSGKSGYVFSQKHPYFKVAAKDKELAKKNFNLPIPKNKK
jgi:SPP1 gp7 family putative phage head morphogenesis protein